MELEVLLLKEFPMFLQSERVQLASGCYSEVGVPAALELAQKQWMLLVSS